jgi:peptidoglycan hydrolase-like protein with peptidoglycan-binding domain
MLAVLAGAAIASGCSSIAADNTRSVAGSDSASVVELQAAQRRVSELESALAARDRKIAETEARLTEAGTSSGTPGASASLFPPNPKAGECYARVLIPAKYQTVSERVLTSEASERIEIIPARYETAEETVLVKEASTKLEVVPAVYEEVQERVLVKPASTKIVEVPAQYDTVTEQVVDTPAHTAWKKGPAAFQSANVLSETTTDTGEIMCLVEVPATYKTVQKRVLVTPARTEEVSVPAEYETVTRTVVKQPPTTREVAIPAQYDSLSVTKLVVPAQENRIAIPAAYETVTRSTKASEERLEWRQVLCEVNMTRSNVTALQRALADKGYYKAGVDGIIGRQTLDAAKAFALDNNLPAGSNYVPIEVVEKLNLDL